MALKPWYKVVTPREDLREGRPLDASEFAVHLDHVRDGRAPQGYQDPKRFFERTYLTKNLRELTTGVARRLAGIKVETSAVYNLTTPFGGGKTHSLTLLYHLATAGPSALSFKGVRSVLDAAGVSELPATAAAVFVGTEFDSIAGRGGESGAPKRFTPWGEIAFQLGGESGFAVVAEHDRQRTAPSTEVIRKFLPKGRPTLILMDELLNYMGRNRKSGLTNQLYSFVQNLTEEVRAQDRAVLVVSLPSLLDEMTSDDEADFDRFQKLLDRVGKAVIVAAETETSEIIRRRLFEWTDVPDEARKTATEYAEWVQAHREQLPAWFPVDHARDTFIASYPFHPTLLSVFERKWQALPRFQQTRGVLRLLALWVSHAYQSGFKGAHKDPLIGEGTAPLDDAMFRSAIFEQLGESKLEPAVTTDICGKKDAHAVRLDAEAVEAIRKARLHQKVATTIFFESNGGQTSEEATLPEVRLAVAEPDVDIGNIETALETLSSICYYLSTEKNRYRFSLSPNLNALLADRLGSVQPSRVDERLRKEIQAVFAGNKIERVYFPDKSGQIPDRPVVALVVLPPEQSINERATLTFIDSATREHGASARTCKSALLWVVADDSASLRAEARKLLAWEDISDEQAEHRLEDSQKRLLAENVKKAARDLKEAVWRTYKHVMLLNKDNEWKTVDLGLVHSSAAPSLVGLIIERVAQEGDIETKVVSPNFLVRHWSGLTEWSTKGVRDAFFASPKFPRLLSAESVKDTIARGVQDGVIAYVVRAGDGRYDPFIYHQMFSAADVEISDDVFIIRREDAERYKSGPARISDTPIASDTPTGETEAPPARPVPAPPPQTAAKSVARLKWSGQVPPQKWMNFYTKVLSRFATGAGMRLTVHVDVSPPEGIPISKFEETKTALRDLGLDDGLESDS